MRMPAALSVALLLGATGSVALSAPITFIVDSESSVTTIEICESLTGSCDSDTSPIAGTITLDLLTPQNPVSASIIDFDFALTQNLNLSYILGFGQTLTITGANLATVYAGDGPTGPVPVGPDGDVFFPVVPILNSGTLSYNTSTLLCVVFQSQNIPCSETIDVSELGVIGTPIQATLTRQGNFLLLELSFSATFDGADLPDSPPISGTITTTLQAVAEVPAPDCPANVTGDGEVNLADLNLVLANFGQQTNQGDTNGDGVVDLADLNAVLAAFGTSCP